MIEIKAELNEILLSGIVGDGWDENPITERGVIDALRSFGSSPVIVRINSPGGAADEGIGIHNALQAHKGEVTTINDSLAASAASIIFLGGAKRLMADGSRLMIHRAMGFAFGNREELAKVINALESYDASLADIYSQYAKLSKSEIENAMANESWYEVEKAIELGFATGRVENGGKKRKTSNAFDQAKVNLLKAKMAQYAGGLK